MELHERVDQIQSRADLVEFVEVLQKDLQANAEAWENATLDDYLSALARWLEDSDGYYRNQGRQIPESPSWRNVAEMLMAATMYE
jgi:type I restriction-modification system DNA methylase subunit